MAAALLAEDTTEAVRQQVEEELARGQAARGAAAGRRAARRRPAAASASRQRDAEVTALSRRADEELAQGGASRLPRGWPRPSDRPATTPAWPTGWPRCRPRRRRNAAAQLDGDQVLVSWEPSPAQAGRVRYRVSARPGPGARPRRPRARRWSRRPSGTTSPTRTHRRRRPLSTASSPIAAATACSPPASHRSRCCSRRTSPRSRSRQPTPRSPSPGGHTREPTPSWSSARRGPPAARNRTTGRRSEASLAGFTDSGLRTGTEYLYRITGVYRAPGGRRRRRPGSWCRRCRPEPEAVTDLDACGASDDGMPHGRGQPGRRRRTARCGWR